jgi:D-glycero-D-manno-heptose 1,7-bisphosphate phosphatase
MVDCKIRKGAFLDRDGVVNATNIRGKLPIPPENVEDLIILPGVIEAVEILISTNYIPVVVTNQPDIARGKTSIEVVNQINEEIRRITKINYFYVCSHDDFSNCDCRKPKPGLIVRAMSELELDAKSSFLVGDRWKDIAAGQKLGLKSFFIDNSYPEKMPVPPFIRVHSLLEAVRMETGL